MKGNSSGKRRIIDFFKPLVEPVVNATGMAVGTAKTALVKNLGSKERGEGIEEVSFPGPKETQPKAGQQRRLDHMKAIRAFVKTGFQGTLKRNRASFDGKSRDGQRAKRLPRQ
jgi:hypothetical protein